MPVVKFLPEIHSYKKVCGSHLPHDRVLQDSHDPLNPVHGHTLLEAAESWKRRGKLQGWSVSTAGLRQMGCAKCLYRGTDSMLLWVGSAGSHEVWAWPRAQTKQFQSLSGHGYIFKKHIRCPTDQNTNSSCFSLQCVVQYVPSHLCQVHKEV